MAHTNRGLLAKPTAYVQYAARQRYCYQRLSGVAAHKNLPPTMNRRLSGLRSRALKCIELSRGVRIASCYGDSTPLPERRQLKAPDPAGCKAGDYRGFARENGIFLVWKQAMEPPRTVIARYARVSTRPRPAAVVGDPPCRSVTLQDHCGGPVAFGVGGKVGVGARTRITRSRPR